MNNISLPLSHAWRFKHNFCWHPLCHRPEEKTWVVSLDWDSCCGLRDHHGGRRRFHQDWRPGGGGGRPQPGRYWRYHHRLRSGHEIGDVICFLAVKNSSIDDLITEVRAQFFLRDILGIFFTKCFSPPAGLILWKWYPPFGRILKNVSPTRLTRMSLKNVSPKCWCQQNVSPNRLQLVSACRGVYVQKYITKYDVHPLKVILCSTNHHHIRLLKPSDTTLYWPAALCSVYKWATWKQNTLELGTNNLGSTELTSQVFAEILKSKLLSWKSQPTHTCDAKITTMTYFLSRESQHTRKWSIFNQMQHRAHHQNYILIIHMQVVGSEGIFGLTLLALAQVRLVLGPIWGKSQYQFIQGRTFWFFLQEL